MLSLELSLSYNLYMSVLFQSVFRVMHHLWLTDTFQIPQLVCTPLGDLVALAQALVVLAPMAEAMVLISSLGREKLILLRLLR